MNRTLLLLLMLTLPLAAKPMMVDLVDVPVDRLIANLEKRVAAHPADARGHYLLARVHSIAYARSVATLPAKKGESEPYFGPFDSGLPPQLTKPGSRKHLEKALAGYKRALELDPNLLPARMGWAWCLEQSGQRCRALEQYRTLFQIDDKGAVFTRTVSEEAGSSLLRLLDPGKDAAEIARVKERLAKLEARPRAMTPILLPLDPATPFERLVAPEAGVPFDLDGSGRKLAWGWPTSEAGWLVYRDRRERVESGLQLVGAVAWWLFWENGYDALSALDDDGDGWLAGPELEHLALWRDAGSDGVFRPEELLSLDSLGIQALSCRSRRHPLGFPYNPAGVLYRDGRVGPSYDWVPATR
ncbi:MAG: hypothetical protein AB1758_01480 [Candidatus Eremiobacterota bacterium]